MIKRVLRSLDFFLLFYNKHLKCVYSCMQGLQDSRVVQSINTQDFWFLDAVNANLVFY